MKEKSGSVPLANESGSARPKKLPDPEHFFLGWSYHLLSPTPNAYRSPRNKSTERKKTTLVCCLCNWLHHLARKGAY